MHKWHNWRRRPYGSQPLHWRHQPSQPPYKSANSAELAERPACHFGEKSAQSATKLHFVHFIFNLKLATTFFDTKVLSR
jgi:hypothetical protein